MKIVNPLHNAQWDNLILESGKHSFFNSSTWAKVLCESYGYEPVYFTTLEGGRLSALVPMMDVRSFLTGRRGISLPFSDYCEPIFVDENRKTDFLEVLKEYAKKSRWRYIEFKGNDYFTEEVACFRYYYGHILHLSGEEKSLLSGMRDSTRRNIRKAQKMGVKTEISTSLDFIGEFYRLNCITRKRHGLPPQPFRFFKKIHEHVLSKNLGLVILASHGGRYVAGAVLFHFGDRAIYKFAASDLKYQELRPNNLVLWTAIRLYAERGCKTLCLGRTEHDAAGLRQFKSGWGADERIIRYFRYDPAKECFLWNCSSNREWYRSAFHLFPMPLLKMTGNLLYRHIA